ncbi:MAG TPA: DPP IV N-terminal domain-containing protein [Acidobacteriota bacterium]|nr:DPP IV N-terminal domain-containing protein [Acidobacteriota bacterium]
MRKKTFSTLAICFLFTVSLWAQNGLEPVKTTDLLKLKTMTGIDISPDESQAVFVLTSIEKDRKGEYRYFRNLWLVDLDKTDKLTQLTFGKRSDSSPAWSPDGMFIAFIRPFEDKPQIWILPITGGEAFRLTDVENGVSNFQWVPNSQKILFAFIIPEWEIQGKPGWSYERPGRNRGDVPNWKKDSSKENSVKPDPDGNIKEIRAWLAKNASEDNPRVFNRQDLQGEMSLQNRLSYSHLFVVEVKSQAEAKQITHGFQSFGSFDWSPDSEKIICTSADFKEHPDRIDDSDLWIMNSDGSDLELFLDWENYRVSSPQYSPDGKTILHTVRDQDEKGYALSQLAVISAHAGLRFN